MTAILNPPPQPADPLGQRLCDVFGRYLWQAIEAELPEDATQSPDWHTITGYPLRPRVLWKLWQDAKSLVGVRFTHETYYALLDIDAGGEYCTADAISQIRAALETIGLTRTLLLRSSWRGGLHLYIPLPELVNTFNLAVALKECLKTQGFTAKAGQLEIFPNVKRWGNAEGNDFSEYNAHRLPLQPGSGSLLLDDALSPVSDSLDRLFWLWDGAAAHQDMESLNQALVIGRDNHRKRPKRRLQVTQSWRDDLETEITEGWTGYGQTNSLLKAIACYGVVFERLQGEALEEYVLRIATTRPGYETYCRHQADIHRRVKAWSKAAESYYWPMGSDPKRQGDLHTTEPALFNQHLAEAAQQRISATVEQLEKLGQLPEAITERAKAIARSGGIGLRTLYKNLTLWHPFHRDKPEQCEIPEPEGVSAILSESEEPDPDPPNTEKIKEFPTSPNFMKCSAPRQGEAGSDPVYFSPDRGARGEEPRFPQVAEPAALYILDEIAQGCRRQIQRLGWSATQLVQFIADRFNGKRRAELSDDELVSLLYQLQSLEGG